MALLIEKNHGPLKKTCLIISVSTTILILFIFKYFNFFNSNIAAIAQNLNLNYPISTLQLILPIGLSFHTFQSLAYVLEVYKGNQKAEKHLGIYALYVMFFPQLVAGPIERPQNLIHQFYQVKTFDYTRITQGLQLIAWGLFKKTVIADNLSTVVDVIFGNVSAYQGPAFTLASIFFAFQIYCDFSGYSDIAIGSARILGFNLMTNFKQPYFSQTIAEFWKRWHISLSTWFKDYIYIPLGGKNCSKLRWSFNILLTFILSGFWHGANWTFIIWGALNACYLILGSWTQEARNTITRILHLNNDTQIIKIIRTLLTFSLICFAWIFFRAHTIDEACYIIQHLTIGWVDLIYNMMTLGIGKSIYKATGYGVKELWFPIFLILLLNIIYINQKRFNINQQPTWLRWLCYYALIITILLAGSFGKNEFIYFQF